MARDLTLEEFKAVTPPNEGWSLDVGGHKATYVLNPLEAWVPYQATLDIFDRAGWTMEIIANPTNQWGILPEEIPLLEAARWTMEAFEDIAPGVIPKNEIKISNSFWPELLAGRPIPVHITEDDWYTEDDWIKAIDEMNKWAPELGLVKLFELQTDPGPPVLGMRGILYFKEEVPPEFRVHTYDFPSGYIDVATGKELIQNFSWPLAAGAEAEGPYNLAGIWHELMHALGLSHPPYRYGDQYVVGSAPQIMPGDIEALKRMFARNIVKKEVQPMPGTKWQSGKSNIIIFKVRPGAPPNPGRLIRLEISSPSQELDPGQAVAVRGVLLDAATGQSLQEFDPSVPEPYLNIWFGEKLLGRHPKPNGEFEATFTAPASGEVPCWAEFSGDE